MTDLRAAFEAWYAAEANFPTGGNVHELAWLAYQAATERAAKLERQKVQAALRHAGLMLVRTEQGLQVMAAITDAQAQSASIGSAPNGGRT